MREENAKLSSHNNHKQRLQYHLQVKQENNTLKAQLHDLTAGYQRLKLELESKNEHFKQEEQFLKLPQDHSKGMTIGSDDDDKENEEETNTKRVTRLEQARERQRTRRAKA